MKRISAALIACALGCALHGPLLEASTEKVLYSFCSQEDCADGTNPVGGVISVNGTLYGTTDEGGTGGVASGYDGTVFALDPTTGVETVLHSFGNGTDGAFPQAGLIDVKGTLYGTTTLGGSRGGGTVYALDPATGIETVPYSFCSQANCADGLQPYAGLIDLKGTLYGTTYFGGTASCEQTSYHGCGSVFSFRPETLTETVLYSFCVNYQLPDCADGAYPRAGLTDVEGTLYGTTYYGGTVGNIYVHYGTMFALNPTSKVETVLLSFAAKRGKYPCSGPIDVNGTLYGTTQYGGSHGGGAVFALDLKTGVETVLHSFCSEQDCRDGKSPLSGLIDVNGMLYGTTNYGGTGGCKLERNMGCGTVFAIDPQSGEETVAYSFDGKHGSYPEAGLTNIDGTLYGTTDWGGTHHGGTVFSIVP